MLLYLHIYITYRYPTLLRLESANRLSADQVLVLIPLRGKHIVHPTLVSLGDAPGGSLPNASRAGRLTEGAFGRMIWINSNFRQIEEFRETKFLLLLFVFVLVVLFPFVFLHIYITFGKRNNAFTIITIFFFIYFLS